MHFMQFHSDWPQEKALWHSIPMRQDGDEKKDSRGRHEMGAPRKSDTMTSVNKNLSPLMSMSSKHLIKVVNISWHAVSNQDI